MLVGFLGSPSSGKTTTAAMVFAALKEQGIPCEFLSEQARHYIAEIRYTQKLNPSDTITLSDADQFKILKQQTLMERILLSSGSGTVIIADSSALNALMYMTPEFRAHKKVQDLAAEAAKEYSYLFWSRPTRMFECDDPNRIHSEEFSRNVDSIIPTVLFPFLKEEPTQLVGTTTSRKTAALAKILEMVSDV